MADLLEGCGILGEQLEGVELAKDLPAGCESREYVLERVPARGAEVTQLVSDDVVQGEVCLVRKQPRYLLRKTRP
jgi:hypothetical protein